MKRRMVVTGLLAITGWCLGTSVGYAETQTFNALHYGNNFLSFHVLPEDPTPANVLGDKMDWVNQIIGEGKVAYQLSDGKWVGNLKKFTREGAYFIFFNLPQDVPSPFSHEIEGTASDPDIQYQLHKGVNWISFPSSQNSALTAGIPDEVEPLFVKVSSEGESSVQTANGWVGSLQAFLPGRGFEIEVTEAVSNFHYGCGTCDNESPYTYGCTDANASNYDETVEIDDKSCIYPVPEDWQPTPGGGQAFYILHDLRINGAKLHAQDAVGAFHNGVNVGFGFPEGDFVTVPAYSLADGDEVKFSIYDASTGLFHPVAPTKPLEWADSAIEVLGCQDETESNFSVYATLGLDNCSGPCEQLSCGDQGVECGLVEDGCGYALDCGECTGGTFCSADNTCVTECVPATCESQGAACGVADDGCGGTLACGSCGEGLECAANECVCAGDNCDEADTTDSPDTEEDTAIGECESDCGMPACDFTCDENAIKQCVEGVWVTLQDCAAEGLLWGFVEGNGESDPEFLCQEPPAEDAGVTEQDGAETDAVELPEDAVASTDAGGSSPEDNAGPAETSEDTTAGNDETSPEEGDSKEATSGEEEVAGEGSEDGCGSCSTPGNSSGMPPRGAIFLWMAMALLALRGRKRLTANP